MCACETDVNHIFWPCSHILYVAQIAQACVSEVRLTASIYNTIFIFTQINLIMLFHGSCTEQITLGRHGVLDAEWRVNFLLDYRRESILT